MIKQRVSDYGEVFTRPREVNAMLELVKQETERIDSRFLEPACGDGNFLAEVLRRKLYAVEVRYARSQLEFERNAVLAVSSLYGIDILPDNVMACRGRLFELFDAAYSGRFKRRAKEPCRAAVRFILKQNIVRGDALTLQTVGDAPQPLEFSEWSFARGSLLKRRVFAFHHLLPKPARPRSAERPLFAELEAPLSDTGEDVFIPLPVREYPLTHFLKVADAQP